MGCDIHPIIEVRDRETKEWYCYGKPDSNRNYAWFGIIAGVRDDKAPTVMYPKNLPKDMSLVTKRELMNNDDLHSHSWLSMAELSEAWRRYIDYIDQEKRNEVEMLVEQAAGTLPPYSKRLDKDEYLPMKDNIWWILEINDNLDMIIPDYQWFDDIRIVFAFDN